MRLRYGYIALLLLCLLVGCSTPSASMKIYIQAESALNGQNQGNIDFGTIYNDCAWDRVAFVRMQAYGHGPASGIGIDDWEMDEFEDWVLFIQDRKVVQSLRRDYDPEQPFDKTIFLEFGADTAYWKVFPRQEARFHATRVAGSGIENIILSR